MKSIASRLWPEPVRVGLSIDHLKAERLARGRPSTIVGTQVRQLASSISTDSPWRCAVSELCPLISTLAGARALVEVVISNRLARYMCLPCSPALRTEADWQGFAAHRFAELFGVRAEAYSILITPRSRSARLACAIEQALVDSIRRALSAAGHRLASLRPRFAVCFDLARHRVDKRDAWFVDYEPEQLTLALALAGEWRAIRQRRAPLGWRAELAEILTRESALAGVSALEPVFLA